MKNHYGFAACMFLFVALALMLHDFTFSEEAKRGEEQKGKKETLYGNFWGPLGGMWKEGLGFVQLPLEECFRFERERWLKRYGACPFRGAGTAGGAEKQWKRYWITLQISLLNEKGWLPIGVSGGEYLFSREGMKPSPPLYLDYLRLEETPIEPIPSADQGGSVMFPQPFPQVVDPDKYTFCDEYYSSDELMIPPPAHSLRIYAGVPLKPEHFAFVSPAYLRSPKLKYTLYDVNYDMDCRNVIKVTFNRSVEPPLRGDRFWIWQTIKARVAAAKGHNIYWLAWEFLDEDGKPLPADYPLPTRWFPDNFKEIFKPIPLPEDLPQVQD